MAAPIADFDEVPIVDVSSIADFDLDSIAPPSESLLAAAIGLGDAFRRAGFAYVRGYESVLPVDLEARLDSESREFFRLPLEEKMKIHMSGSGRAWRGYFPCGEELTSGRPDIKEGLYLGQELGEDDPRVAAGLPVHGRNLFPERPAGLRAAVLDYMTAAEKLGQKLMALVALSLGLPASFFVRGCTRSPLCLFRAFHYPPPATLGPGFQDPDLWGVGEHTDYGLLTLLKQDVVGGLQLKNRRNEWVPAPFVPNTLVINIGDMLEVRQARRRYMQRHLQRASPACVLSLIVLPVPHVSSLSPCRHLHSHAAGDDARPLSLHAAPREEPLAHSYARDLPVLLRPWLRRCELLEVAVGMAEPPRIRVMVLPQFDKLRLLRCCTPTCCLLFFHV